jgi:hypothetical protein
MQTERYSTILVPELLPISTPAAVAIQGWMRRADDEIVEQVIWLPRNYRDRAKGAIIAMRHNAHNVEIDVPEWLLAAKQILTPLTPAGCWMVCEVGAVVAAPDRGDWPVIATLDAVQARRAPRHVDAIFGDLQGVEELLQEGMRDERTFARANALRAELRAAEQLRNVVGLDGPHVPCGWEVNPDFEGAAAHHDGEVEIASEIYGVPLDTPNFWYVVECRMIETGHRSALRALPGVNDHRRQG